jgi:UDP-glucose 4-epimerase
MKDRRKGDPESLVANVKRLKKLLNFKPKFNDIKKSILSSVKWEEKINKKKYYLN